MHCRKISQVAALAAAVVLAACGGTGEDVSGQQSFEKSQDGQNAVGKCFQVCATVGFPDEECKPDEGAPCFGADPNDAQDPREQRSPQRRCRTYCPPSQGCALTCQSVLGGDFPKCQWFCPTPNPQPKPDECPRRCDEQCVKEAKDRNTDYEGCCRHDCNQPPPPPPPPCDNRECLQRCLNNVDKNVPGDDARQRCAEKCRLAGCEPPPPPPPHCDNRECLQRCLKSVDNDVPGDDLQQRCAEKCRLADCEPPKPDPEPDPEPCRPSCDADCVQRLTANADKDRLDPATIRDKCCRACDPDVKSPPPPPCTRECDDGCLKSSKGDLQRCCKSSC